MAFQPVPNSVSAEVVFSQDAVVLENVFHFTRTSTPSSGQIQTLAEIIDQWVDDEWKPLIATGVDYVRTVVTGLSSINDYQASVSTNAGAGTGGSVVLPANVSKAITLRSGLTGRNARGRLYLVGLSTSAVDLGTQTVGSTFIDDVIDALEALKALIEAAGWVWSIVSRYLNKVERATAVTFPVTQFAVHDFTTDSMRGRLPKS